MADLLSPGQIAQLSCLIEATARKPGNVHRFCDFSDSGYLDYVLSASVIGPALDGARVRGIGHAVLAAVRATRAVVATNTNLGMILLLAPLAAVGERQSLQVGVESVLQATTIDDASRVYEAVRLAKPGGLGSANEQDVAREPTVTLLEAMSLAAGRDSVARQYSNGFAEVFGVAVPRLRDSLARSRDLESAVISTQLGVLAEIPDTLIARKLGHEAALQVSQRATAVLAAGWPNRENGVRLFQELDRWLRDDSHSRNPGTTADLVTAALFVALSDGTIRLPLAPRDWGEIAASYANESG